jgi:bacteriochlorophyllide a dehydrogenase
VWMGDMPPFPGLGYPLVPGYESVGVITEAADSARIGECVFVPGASCYSDVRGLFGGACQTLIVPDKRALTLPSGLDQHGVLLALAATAYHAIAAGGVDNGRVALPDLIVGHGVVGRLLARIAVSLGGSPTVWESQPDRMSGACGYHVTDADNDTRRDYRHIFDASGASDLLDTLIGRLAIGGEVVLAGFYAKPLSFVFPPAFMREARIRVAAEWQTSDLRSVLAMLQDGELRLDGLITHEQEAGAAEAAYQQAFSDPRCLKMVLNWSEFA